jgi:hypothetical protein
MTVEKFICIFTCTDAILLFVIVMNFTCLCTDAEAGADTKVTAVEPVVTPSLLNDVDALLLISMYDAVQSSSFVGVLDKTNSRDLDVVSRIINVFNLPFSVSQAKQKMAAYACMIE